MKVLPINNYNRFVQIKNPQQKVETNHNAPQKESNFLIDKNYSQLLVKNSPSFKAANINEVINLVQLVPLEDKIAAFFPKFRRGDMIVAGDKLPEIQKILKTSIKNIEEAIKKIIFIHEPDFKGCLVFTKNNNGLNEIWNFNKEPIILNNVDMLKTNESYYVAQGDVLTLKDQSITIKERPQGQNPLRPNNLSAFTHLFSTTYDFSKEATSCIERLNKKNVSTLVKTTKGKANKFTFADVGGQAEIIDHLKKNILYPIKFPEAYANFPINHGTILFGPPGTGKSLIAEAIANESEATYKKLNGLELESKWVGESEENWRNLFAEAIDNQPSIIFIDEFDAVARRRSGKNEYGDNVVNQILTLMSDLEKSGDDVYIITATNNYEALDPAIKRPGRFGHHLEVKIPDLDGTKQILTIHTSQKPIAKDIDLNTLADKMFARKMTGAEIAHIVTTAHTNAFERSGIYAKMESGKFTPKDMKNFEITLADFEKAMNDYKPDATNRKPVGFKI